MSNNRRSPYNDGNYHQDIFHGYHVSCTLSSEGDINGSFNEVKPLSIMRFRYACGHSSRCEASGGCNRVNSCHRWCPVKHSHVQRRQSSTAGRQVTLRHVTFLDTPDKVVNEGFLKVAY